MKYAVMVAALFSLLPHPSTAQNLDGNSLLEACEASEQDVRLAFCTGYILGLVEGIKWGSVVSVMDSGAELETADLNGLSDVLLGYCNPAEVELRQHRDIVVNYLLAHPERRHETARGLALDAFREAFPCSVQ